MLKKCLFLKNILKNSIFKRIIDYRKSFLSRSWNGTQWWRSQNVPRFHCQLYSQNSETHFYFIYKGKESKKCLPSYFPFLSKTWSQPRRLYGWLWSWLSLSLYFWKCLSLPLPLIIMDLKRKIRNGFQLIIPSQYKKTGLMIIKGQINICQKWFMLQRPQSKEYIF